MDGLDYRRILDGLKMDFRRILDEFWAGILTETYFWAPWTDFEGILDGFFDQTGFGWILADFGQIIIYGFLDELRTDFGWIFVRDGFRRDFR